MITIGIDPGVTTGIAVWDCEQRKLTHVKSMSILEAMKQVREAFAFHGSDCFVIVEDARKRKVYNFADARAERGPGVREGVGSIKRDSSIWEEFLTAEKIPHLLRSPRITKIDAKRFELQTGWDRITNQHGRDAAMIVFGLNLPMAHGLRRNYEQSAGAAK